MNLFATFRQAWFGEDENLDVRDAGDRLVVAIQDPDRFSDLSEPVPLDPRAGIMARMGVDEDGRQDIVELHFLTTEGFDWNQNRVRSFLAENGFDALDRTTLGMGPYELAYDHGILDADAADIEETDDYWIIRDNVLTRDGVFNGMLRPAEVLDAAWQFYEGIPVTHPHPPDIVQDLEQVGGIVENVRLDRDDDGVRVIGDYRLARRTGIDGLNVSEAMVERNRETVDRVRDGVGVDNSQGYLKKFREESGEQDGKEYTSVLEELVPNHLAILLDKEGACNWEDGCGVARLGLDQARALLNLGAAQHTRPPLHADEGTGDGAPQPREEPHMGDEPECGGDCATAAEVAQERDEVRAHLDSITEQLQPVADRYDMDEPDAEALVGQVSEDLDRLAAIEEQEREAKEQLAQETAELEAALGRIEEEATSERAETLAGWNTDALAEYNGIVTGIAKERGLIEAEAQADHSRVAGEGRDGQPARDGKRLTVGVPNPDGEWEA